MCEKHNKALEMIRVLNTNGENMIRFDLITDWYSQIK